MASIGLLVSVRENGGEPLPHDNSFILSFLAIGVFIVQAFIINRRADVAEKLGGRSHRVIRPCNLAPVVRRGCRPTLVIVYAYA